MKKLINTIDTIVEDMLAGYVAAHSDRVALSSNPRVLVRTEKKPAGKVGLIIGNGSGHEPIAMGWVGHGLLDGNVVGDIFAAPSALKILDGIKAVNTGGGVVVLISSHSGDIINGEAAIEDALELGIDARPLLMYDDISSAPKGREDERRGAPGTTFIYKILGGAAEEGQDIDSLISLGERVRDGTRTLGVAVAPGVSPLTGKAMFDLLENRIFIGMGVHGEPGLGQREIGPVQEVVEADAVAGDNQARAVDRAQALGNADHIAGRIGDRERGGVLAPRLRRSVAPLLDPAEHGLMQAGAAAQFTDAPVAQHIGDHGRGSIVVLNALLGSKPDSAICSIQVIDAIGRHATKVEAIEDAQREQKLKPLTGRWQRVDAEISVRC